MKPMINSTPPTAPSLRGDTGGMIHLSGGTYKMGSDDHYPEERPAHRVSVDAFWIDATPVTNRQFADFVEATGHVTFAEIPPDPRDYPGALPEMLRPASLVFQPPAHRVTNLSNWNQWWNYRPDTNWRQPLGPGSSIDGMEDHPVVHVTAADAEAYAAWAGKSLPTEAQWEFAARGGLDGADYAWGDALTPGGQVMANTWFGLFPFANQSPHGWTRTSPVGSFPANGYGLHDMIGNVWEWTADWWSVADPRAPVRSCCVPANPRGGSERAASTPSPAVSSNCTAARAEAAG